MDQMEPDFATDLGPAFQARSSSIDRVRGEWRGAFRDGGIDARRMHDTTVHDIMLKCRYITAVQHEAADRLYGLWCGGGFQRPVTSGYGQRAGGRSLRNEDELTSQDEYRALMRSMPFHVSVYSDTLMMLEWRNGNLAGVRGMLDWLVKEWGL